jgi:hypothetical protein
MADEYKRLLQWATDTGTNMTVNRPDQNSERKWKIHFQIQQPVSYRLNGVGGTIDEAAAKVIEQLETVGATVK